MLTTVMFIYMLLRTGIRLLAEAIMIPLRATELPLTILIVTGVIVLCGLGLAVFRIVKHENRLALLIGFYAVDILSILFNLFFVASFVPSQVGGLDVLITGTLIDVLIDAFFVVAAILYARNQKYVKIKEDFKEPKGEEDSKQK